MAQGRPIHRVSTKTLNLQKKATDFNGKTGSPDHPSEICDKKLFPRKSAETQGARSQVRFFARSPELQQEGLRLPLHSPRGNSAAFIHCSLFHGAYKVTSGFIAPDGSLASLLGNQRDRGLLFSTAYVHGKNRGEFPGSFPSPLDHERLLLQYPGGP